MDNIIFLMDYKIDLNQPLMMEIFLDLKIIKLFFFLNINVRFDSGVMVA